MTIPLWSLLVAVSLPYLWFGLSNPLRKQEFGTLDNSHPRLQEARQTGKGARALGASSNAFEALACYAPAVLVAHIQAPASELAPKIAIAWIVLRVAHGFLYIGDKPAARTTAFTLGMVCVAGLFLVAARVV
jgi:uncharacterized MAPEG superfamily protein